MVDPLTSTEGLPPLPRRGMNVHAAKRQLTDAPRKLRGLADDDAEHFVGLEHDGLGGAVLVGPDEFRRWADAIEALLR